jgi:hypothetical protein
MKYFLLLIFCISCVHHKDTPHSPEDGEEVELIRAPRAIDILQNDNGSFGEQYPEILTCFSVLLNLANNETPKSRTYGNIISKQISYLETLDLDNLTALELALYVYTINETLLITESTKLLEIRTKAIKKLISTTHSGNALFTPQVSKVYQNLAIRALSTSYYYNKKTDTHLEEILVNCRLKLLKEMNNITNKDSVLKISATLNSAIFLFEDQKSIPPKLINIFHVKSKQIILSPTEYDLMSIFFTTYTRFNLGGKYWQHWNIWFQEFYKNNQQANGFWSNVGSVQSLGLSEKLSLNDEKLLSTYLIAAQLSVYYHYSPHTLHPTTSKIPLYQPNEDTDNIDIF